MSRAASAYSEEIATQILEHIEDGGTIESACKLDGTPSPSTLRRWRKGEGAGVVEGFGERFEAALQVRLEGFIDDLIQIPREIDTNSPGAVQQARLECENRRWLLSKMLREKFGDRTAVDVGGQEDNPMTPSPEAKAHLEAMSPGMRAVLQKACHFEMMEGGMSTESSERLQGMIDDLQEAD